jgi:hypothetical protein
MVAEKDWDKTAGTAADARRIFENVPAEFADLAANIAAGTGGFVLAGPARAVDRICSETIELLLRSTGYTTMSHCLRRNGAHQHRRYTWRWMRRSTPPARFAPGFVNGRWRSAPIPPTSLTSCTQSPSAWRTQVVEASLAGNGNLHADYWRADASPVPTGELRHRRAGQSGDLPTGHRLRVRFPCRRCRSHHRQRRPQFTHRVHLGPSDRCRKPFRHGAFDDRSESGHPPRVGRRQRAGRRPRPGAQAGWRLRAGRPARKPGAPGQERLRRGVDRGQEFWPCRT